MSDPFYQADRVTLYLGDCIEVMRSLPEDSVDAIVTDPPYGLEFMGKEWDSFGRDTGNGYREKPRMTDDHMGKGFHSLPNHFEAGHPFQRWCEAWAREAYRVLKPGGHIAAFGGTRTHHRLVCGIEDAGFEIRDEADWMYGSGFPKGQDLERAIAREQCSQQGRHFWRRIPDDDKRRPGDHVCGSTRDSLAWTGFDVALKPAHEPICLARKPLSGTVAANVLAHGTGALNIDGCRIESPDADLGRMHRQHEDSAGMRLLGGSGYRPDHVQPTYNVAGRWPANVIFDEEAAALLDATVGGSVSRIGEPRTGVNGNGWGMTATGAEYGDRGGPSRFFYTAKASRSEREAGLDDLPPALRTDGRKGEHHTAHLRTNERRNDHPTVKPVSLMRWLCKLITPPGGVVLDPFLGSGSTGLAALDEGFRFIGIDMTERFVEIARYRVTHRHILEVEVKESNEKMPQGRLL